MANHNDPYKIFAKNLSNLMKEKGVYAQEVCRALGIKQNTFSDWINGKTYPRIKKIDMLSEYFGVARSDLVEDQGNKHGEFRCTIPVNGKKVRRSVLLNEDIEKRLKNMEYHQGQYRRNIILNQLLNDALEKYGY